MKASTTEAWVRAWLGASRSTVACGTGHQRVGELDLAEHQSRAVERGIEVARKYGGVLIADAVGLGKTRVGLGIARGLLREERRIGAEDAQKRAWVCAPARLREDWREVLAEARVNGEVISHTELSRDGEGALAGNPGVVIVDEAHRFRNPSADRTKTLAELAARAPVVLITATPVCNDVWDLYNLLALFLAEDDLRPVTGYDLQQGFERAETGDWDLAELLERVAIRRRDIDGWSNRPSVRLEKLTYEPGDAERWVWAHLESKLRELSLEAFATEWPRGLFVEHVRKRWESAPQAAARTIDRVSLFHRRWLQAARHGHRLGRAEYKTWFGGDERQEVMPFVLDGSLREEKSDVSDTSMARVQRDLEIVDELADRLHEAVEESAGAARAVAELAAGSQDKMLVFCEYYQTAETYFRTLTRRLGAKARVGLVTGQRAMATGLGSAEPGDIRARFAPTASSSSYEQAHEQLQVLVATDCLAEGVNLQDCGVLVLADMPYSPLRVEQRVGRLVRPGSPHGEVRVYVPEPSDWVETLGLQARVSRKVEQARRVGSQPAAAASVTARKGGGGEKPVGEEALPWEPVGPMEAVTRLDALYRKLRESDAIAQNELGLRLKAPDGTSWWRESGVPDDQIEGAWARWSIGEAPPDGERSDEARQTPELWGWARIRADQLTVRRSHLVKALTATAQSARKIHRCEARPGWITPLEEWLEDRVATLRSSHLAPTPIGMRQPQWKLWSRVREAVRNGDLECDAETVKRVRENLLCSVPQGERRKYERWWESDPSPAEIIHRMQTCEVAHGDETRGALEGSIRSVLLVGAQPRAPESVESASR